MDKRRLLIAFPIYVVGLTVINVLGYSLGFGDGGPIPVWLWIAFSLVSVLVVVVIIAYIGNRYAGRTFPREKNRAYITLAIALVVTNIFESICFELFEVRTVWASIPVAVVSYLITIGILYWRSAGLEKSSIPDGHGDV